MFAVSFIPSSGAYIFIEPIRKVWIHSGTKFLNISKSENKCLAFLIFLCWQVSEGTLIYKKIRIYCLVKNFTNNIKCDVKVDFMTKSHWASTKSNLSAEL